MALANGELNLRRGDITNVDRLWPVQNTTLVTNLNADLLDGLHAADFAPTATDELFGFDDIGTSAFTMVGTTFRLTGTYNYFYAGTLVQKTAATDDVDCAGFMPGTLRYIAFNAAGGLVAVTSAALHFNEYVPVATVYFDGTRWILAEERHTFITPWEVHRWMHLTAGVRWEGGFTASLVNPFSFTVDEGAIDDDGLRTSIGAQTTCRRLYRSGTVMNVLTASTTYLMTSTGVLDYDNAGVLTEVSSGEFVAYWVFATPDVTTPIYVIAGQRVDSNIANARVNASYQALTLGTLPSPEMKLLYRVILKRTGAAVSVEDVSDYRNVSNLPAGTYVATDHGSLSGLADPDHVATSIEFSATARLLGRGTALGGAGEEIAVTSPSPCGLTMAWSAGALAIGHITDTPRFARLGLGAAADGTASLLLTTVANAAADVDKFLVLDAGNRVDFRTGAEVLSDIGAAATAHTQAATTITVTATSRLLGRGGAGAGAVEEMTLASSAGLNLAYGAGTLNIGATTDTPRFARLGLGVAAHGTDVLTVVGKSTFSDTIIASSTVQATGLSVGRVATAALDIYSAAAADILSLTENGNNAYASIVRAKGNGGSTSIGYWGTGAGGNIFGAVPYADAGIVWFTDCSNGVIGTFSSAPLYLVTDSTARLTIAAAGAATFSSTVQATGLSVGAALISGASISLGNTTTSSTATPLNINLGGTYANAVGDPTKAKLKLYDDTTNVFGIGVSASSFELYSKANSQFDFYCGTRLIGGFYASGTATSINLIGNTGGPAYLTLTADTGADNGDTWRVRSDHTTNYLQLQNNITGTVATKAFFDQYGVFGIPDGVTAPAASVAGFALIYIDTADGDLKIRFADGTVKTIVVDT